MTDINQIFAIVPVNGKPPDDAICWGTLGECTEFVAQSVARVAVEQRIAEAKEQIQTDAKTLAQAQHKTLDAATRLTAMGHAMVAAQELKVRKDTEAKRIKAEQAEARRVQDLLDRLPDPDNPDAGSGDDGELEVKFAPNKEHLQEQPDSFGDLPEDIRKQSPSPHLGPDYETNISNLSHPQKPQEQPAAISLNSR
jgi:hypothetical protein